MQGYEACEGAAEAFSQGRVGVGTGATVAKLNGPEHAAPGGLASVSERDGDLVVSALVAVNALGEIVDDDGQVLAGPTGGAPREPGIGNTTLAVVATNASLNRERAHLLATAAHDGFDAAIRPAHTLYDGDTVFTLATGPVDAPQGKVEAMAVRAVAAAIRKAVAPGAVER
jgi:L-aminopeptidase/D-esterase-like protein